MISRHLLAMPFLAFAMVTNANASLITINDPATSSGYNASYYISTAKTSPETHIISVYETRADHAFGFHPVGTAHVHIAGTASVPVNLVLSSYEPTQWILDGSGMSFVRSVLINSYYVSTATGIDPSIVQSVHIGAYAFAWPSASATSMVADVEVLYGAPISTFSGVYRATDFSVALASSLPEPNSAMLLLCGLGCVGMALQTNKKRSYHVA